MIGNFSKKSSFYNSFNLKFDSKSHTKLELVENQVDIK